MSATAVRFAPAPNRFQGRTNPRPRAPRRAVDGYDRSAASMFVRRWPGSGRPTRALVEHVLHPLDFLERMQRVSSETQSHRPQARRHVVEFSVIRAHLWPVTEPIPSTRALFVVGVDLSLAVLNRFPGVAVTNEDLVLDVVACVGRRAGGSDRERVGLRDVVQLVLLGFRLAAARDRTHRDDNSAYSNCAENRPRPPYRSHAILLRLVVLQSQMR